MSKKYELIIDPSPAGWAHGFPKALPKEGVLGSGYDLFVNPGFDLVKWVVEQGYPEESFQYYRLYPQEVKDVQKEYYYPGSDPQE